MQLMPGTQRDLGVADAFDPRQNVDAERGLGESLGVSGSGVFDSANRWRSSS